jgi:hypothetical protein
MRILSKRLLAAAVLLVPTAPLMATETITFRYDAHGRLVQVERTGTVNNGVAVTHSYDKADNRVTRTKTP